MEALRIKIDNLEREVERVTVENRKLREDDPGASERLDREAELQSDVAELTNRMEVLQQQLAERISAAEDAEVRAGQAEARAAEMQRLAGEFDIETKASEEIAGLRQTVRANEEIIGENRQIISEWERRWEEEEQHRKAAGGALLRQAELERHRALEEERRRGGEAYLFSQPTGTREQLRAAKTAIDAGNNGAENNGLENVGERLQRLESMMRILLEENYQRSPQQRQQSVVDRTQPLQATDWDTEQQSSGGRGTPREHRSSEGGGAQVLLDLGNRDKQPWTDGGMLWGAGTGPQ